MEEQEFVPNKEVSEQAIQRLSLTSSYLTVMRNC